MHNTRSVVVFIIIALLVYASLNLYLYRRTMQAASPVVAWACVLRIIILIGFLAFPLGRIIGAEKPLGTTLVWIGSFWLAVLTYGVLIALLVDIIRLIDLLTGWLPDWALADRLKTSRMIFAGSLVLIVMLIVGGHIRSLYPKTPEYTIELEKFPTDIEEYRIVMLADLHLGILVGEKRLNRMLGQVEGQFPDLVAIVGDLIDESTEKLSWAVDPLSKIEASDGVYAVTGNHEFYNGLKGFNELTRNAGIITLRNQSVEIKGVITLVGLDDPTGYRQFNLEQVPIAELLNDVDHNLPVVLMQHTPTRLNEARNAGVDLMLCGHVHGGQLWPVKYIAEAVYGVKTGLSHIGRMYFYLTSGAGTWGPPVRVGATPEIVTFVLRKKEV